MDADTSTNIDTTVDYSNREILAKMLHKETVSFLTQLDAIWDEMGIEGDLRSQRGNMVVKHVTELYRDILTEANEHKTALCDKITAMLKDLGHLERELQVDIPYNRSANIPLYSVKKGLEEHLQQYQNIYATRKAEILELLSREQTLSEILGIASKPLAPSPLPNEEKIAKFRSYTEQLVLEKSKREVKFNGTKVAIIDIMAELKIKPSLDFEKNVIYNDVTEFKVTEENMRLLDEFYASLKSQLEDTKSKIQDLREKVTTLWERLEESPEKRSKFLELHPGNSVQTLKALKAEVVRCEELKRQNIKIFIDKMRHELVYWWDKCRYSDIQRQEFIHFYSNCYTEDLLTFHEMEVEKLKYHYEKNQEIYELVTQREGLWEKMLELQHRANQPDRFKNRGGQLLMEEKERKAVASKLPKIEHKLLELVEQYEAESGKTLLINGEVVSDMILNAWEAHKENKHIQLSAKKQARENTIRTPHKTPLRTTLRTPMKTPMMPTNNTPRLTPHVSSAIKRKLATPLFGTSKRTRSGEGKTKLPTLKVNDKTLKRASTERRKRLARKRMSRAREHTNVSIASTASDYNNFEMGLEDKDGCRSTLFTNKQGTSAPAPAAMTVPTATNSKVVSPCSTPRRTPRMRNPLQQMTNTPIRTPARPNMRAKSPAHLVPALGNIPIIM